MLIKNMLEDLGDSALETPVPIPNVSLPFSYHVFRQLLTLILGQ